MRSLIGLGRCKKKGQYFSEALEIATTINDLVNQVEALIGLRNARVDDKNNYSKALELARKINDEELQIEALIALGNARVDDKNNYSKAFELARKLGKEELQLKALVGLGNCRTGKEFDFYNQALTISTKLNDMETQVTCLLGLGSAKFDHSLGSARDYFIQAQRLAGNNKALAEKVKPRFARLRSVDKANYLDALDFAKWKNEIPMQISCYIGLMWANLHCYDFAFATKNLEFARKLCQDAEHFRAVEEAVQEIRRDYKDCFGFSQFRL